MSAEEAAAGSTDPDSAMGGEAARASPADSDEVSGP